MTSEKEAKSLTSGAQALAWTHARIAMLYSFSSEFIELARRFAGEAAIASPRPFDIGLPMTTVILAATGLESFVNEEIERCLGDRPKMAATHAKLLKQGDWLGKKWSDLLRAAVGRPFDIGEDLQQAFGSLVELRNLIVHRAARVRFVEDFPETEARKGRPAFKVKDLDKLFDFTTHAGGGLSWERQVLNARCAKWAFDTAIKMMREHYRVLGVRPPEHPKLELLS